MRRHHLTLALLASLSFNIYAADTCAPCNTQVKELQAKLAKLKQSCSLDETEADHSEVTDEKIHAKLSKLNEALNAAIKNQTSKDAAIKNQASKDIARINAEIEFYVNQLEIESLSLRKTYEKYLAEKKSKAERATASRSEDKKSKKEPEDKEKSAQELAEGQALRQKLRQDFEKLDQVTRNKINVLYKNERLWKMLYMAQSGGEQSFDVSPGAYYHTNYNNFLYLNIFSLEELKAIHSFLGKLKPDNAKYHQERVGNRITELEGNETRRASLAKGSIKRALEKLKINVSVVTTGIPEAPPFEAPPLDAPPFDAPPVSAAASTPKKSATSGGVPFSSADLQAQIAAMKNKPKKQTTQPGDR